MFLRNTYDKDSDLATEVALASTIPVAGWGWEPHDWQMRKERWKYKAISYILPPNIMYPSVRHYFPLFKK